ncbi:MAG: flagellar motor protein MotB [Micavibrio aeruginosavorus]|nr:flagellar motor protein MotB [Micavibrio aeruginosavorus]
MILRRRRNISPEQRNGIGSQLLGLSLFIMLLAFFMVLNSISQYEQKKSENIFKNLEDTFSASIAQAGNDKPSIIRSDEKHLGEGDVLEQIEAYFTAQIPGFKAVKEKQRGVMIVHVRKSDFEEAVRGLGAGKKQGGNDFARGFLPVLVALMRSEQRGLPYRMDITYQMDENPARLQNDAPQRMAETVHTVAEIAGVIEKAGLKPQLMTIGLQEGNPDTVELVFRPHAVMSADAGQSKPGGGDVQAP